MSKTVKIWLITAASLVLMGAMIFGGVMTVFKWNFAKLSTAKYETNDYQIDENYNDISIVTHTAHVALLPSENESARVECYEQKNVKHSVEVKDGTLVIEVVDTRKWYEYIGIHFGAPKVTVYLPAGEYGALSVKARTGGVEIAKAFSFESIDVSESTGDVKSYASASESLKIKTSTGDIFVENVSAGSLDLSVSTGAVKVSGVRCAGDVTLSVSTGKAYLTDVSCNNLASVGTTGELLLKDVIAQGRISLERTTADVRFEDADAEEIFVKTDTGSVTGTLLSEKVFIPRTSTGKIDVPKTANGGRCEITTTTGNIKISVN